jgi:hypothetical protein
MAQGIASARWNVQKGMRNRQTEVTIFAKPPCATMKPAVPHWSGEGYEFELQSQEFALHSFDLDRACVACAGIQPGRGHQ